MSFVLEKTFQMARGDRLQIGLESDFDPSLTKELLHLHPIEVITLGFTSTITDVKARYPRGLKINLLPKTESVKPYYVNTNGRDYRRLYLNAAQECFGWFIAHVEGDLSALAHNPIVVQLEHYTESPRFLFSAIEQFKFINNLEHPKNRYSAFPESLPEELVSLTDVVHETLPGSRLELEILIARLTSLQKALTMYLGRRLPLEVGEEVAVLIAMVNDHELKAKALLSTLKETDSYSFVLEKLVHEQLKQSLGQQRYIGFMRKAHAMARNEIQSQTQSLSFKEPFALINHVTTLQDDEDMARDVKRLLLKELTRPVLLHPCKLCGEEARVYPFGRKFTVKCSKCDASVDPSFNSTSASYVSCQWNVENEVPDPSFWLAVMEIEGESEIIARKNINKRYAMLSKMLATAKSILPSNMTEVGDVARMKEMSAFLRFVSSMFRA